MKAVSEVTKVTEKCTYTVHTFDVIADIFQFLLKVVLSILAALICFLHPSFCLLNSCITP